MQEDPAARDVVDDITCEVGVRTSNVEQLKECTAALAAHAPDNPKTISYQWALAIQEGQLDEAGRLVERAKAAGITPESVASMQQTTAASTARHRSKVVFALLSVTLLMGAAFFVGRVLQRQRRALDEEPLTRTA
jgi:hypothetical protein